MKLPKISQRHIVYENQYQQVYRVKADFGNFSKDYFVTDTGHRAGIVVIKNGSVLLVRQYRLLINDVSWEIPGGKVDIGETPETAAVRECLEETGVGCSNPRQLIFYHPGLDTRHNPTHLFYSENPGTESYDLGDNADQVAGSEWVPLSRCIDMVFEGKIVDSFSIIGLLAYQRLATGTSGSQGYQPVSMTAGRIESNQDVLVANSWSPAWWRTSVKIR